MIPWWPLILHRFLWLRDAAKPAIAERGVVSMATLSRVSAPPGPLLNTAAPPTRMPNTIAPAADRGLEEGEY